MKTSQIVKKLKSNNQDFEYYPTTDTIINKINEGIKGSSILDIGCGNGQTLLKLKPSVKYGIEKSQILLDIADPKIIVVGRDFHKQQLIDKKVDNIFCNPPYSEFKQWMIKIIKESNCKDIYFVVPKRWREDDEIQEVIKKRGLTDISIGFFDFLDGERKARAEIEILHIFFTENFGYSNHSNHSSNYKDPFDIFFEETFKFNIQENQKNDFDFNKDTENKIQNELVKGDDLIKTLVRYYNADLNKLLNNYRKLETLDQEIFEELNVDFKKIKECLKLRVENLKTLYWKELFNKLDKLCERLTCKNRNYISSKIINIADFNSENIYSIVIWAIKNANNYIDSQLVDLFFDLTDEKNIRNYKSNQKTWKDVNWRWNSWNSSRDTVSRYKLDYRIIIEGYKGALNDYCKIDKIDIYNRGHKVNQILRDIATCSRNLNMEIYEIPVSGWSYGKARSICYKGEDSQMMEVRLFKNGNIHIKFEQEFIKKLNIEVGRIKKWIHTPEEASQEMGEDLKTCNEYFNSAVKIKKDIKLLK